MVHALAPEIKHLALDTFSPPEDGGSSLPGCPAPQGLGTEVGEVTETLRLLVDPDREFELRALSPPEYCRFKGDCLEEAAEWAVEQSFRSKNVYGTINPLNTAPGWEGEAACDRDVSSRRWILVDTDPVRPADVSATDEEKEFARLVALGVRDWLRDQGFPEPVLADSGNGWHLLYRVDLPAADHGLVKRVLQALAARFNTAAVKIDTTVSNASRITKVYGTVARKGKSSPGRPHRKSALLEVPTELRSVPVQSLEAIAIMAPQDSQGGNPLTGPHRRAPVTVPGLSREEAVKRATAYVRTMPPAVSGQGGHDQTFEVACRLIRDFGLMMQEALPVIEEYNLRCDPKWEPWELEHKLADADDFDGPRGLYLVEFSNYREEGPSGRKGDPERKGISCPVVASNLFNVTGGWPKVAGGGLFVPGPNFRPRGLTDSNGLFAWISSQLAATQQNPVRWAEGPDKVTRGQFYSYLLQNAEAYEAVEPFPHHPARPYHFYLHPEVTGGDGKALADVLARFNPATETDRQLIKVMFLTPFWGGPGGSRPAFLITCEEDDVDKGRGVGKTTLAELVGHLVGGVVSFSKEETPEFIMKRLLSPSALDKRVVLFDNVKTLKFSSEVLEGLLTATKVSGWKPYEGDSSRPNTLTYIMTINGASLSKDMAQRCVTVKVRRPPAYSGNWEEEVTGFIDANRWSIIGDILAELRREVPPLAEHSRWGQWERDVLARCEDVAECQRLIAERRGDVDGDQDEADLVRETFLEDLRKRKFDPSSARVWYPAKAAAGIVNYAMEDNRPTNKATAYLNTLAIKEVHQEKFEGSRGYTWRGAKALPETARVKFDSDNRRGLVC